MAKPVTLSQFQQMQRGKGDALGDAEIGTHDVAVRDPLTGGVVDADPFVVDPAAEDAAATARLKEIGCGHQEPTMADELISLDVGAACTAEMSLGMIRARVAERAVELDAYPSEDEIVFEAERIWRSFDENRTGPAEHTYTVAPDGEIRDWREVVKDRGNSAEADGEPTTHIITDDGPRFSGAGAEDDDLPFGQASDLIPSDASFQNRLYQPAPALANLAEKLIGEHGFLDDLNACTIDYRWRRKGGGSKGKAKIGFLKRVSNELTIFTTANFILWLAADTARTAGFTDRQVEAAVFHQLLHISQDDKGNWIKVPHDFEGFGTEVRHYGPWTSDLKIGSEAFTTAVQLGLDFDEDDDDDEGEEIEASDFVPARMATSGDLSPDPAALPADSTAEDDPNYHNPMAWTAEDEAQHEGAHEVSLYDEDRMGNPPPDAYDPDADPLPFVEEARG